MNWIRRGGALALAVAAALPGWSESSVWRAELDGETVYLGGTCHLLRPSDFPLPPEFDQAYAAADVLFFETDIEQMEAPATQLKLLELGMLADDSTLKEQLNTEAWEALVKYCDGQGIPLAAFSRMKPWMVTVTLAVLEWQKQGAVQEGVDVHYHRKAVQDGKASRALESLDDHLAFIAHMGEGQESEMVLSTLEELETTPEMIAALIAAWRTGDLKTLDEEMVGDMREEFPQVYDELVAGRNRAWLPQILAMFKQPGTEYVLVGAGHFGGDAGLLALLRAAGVVIEPVEVAASVAPAPR